MSGRTVFRGSVPSASARAVVMVVMAVSLLLVSVSAVLIDAPVAQGAVLADSLADFSGVQGSNGWYYGYYASPPTPTFTQMSYFDPTATDGEGTWFEQQGTYWTRVFRDGGHPESVITSGGTTPTDQWAVRRWVSSVSGSITISGTLVKRDPGGGDGITGRIIVDGTQIWSRAIAATDTTGVTYSIQASVHVGSTVDFAIDPNLTDFFDSTTFTAQITAPAAATGGDGSGWQVLRPDAARSAATTLQVTVPTGGDIDVMETAWLGNFWKHRLPAVTPTADALQPALGRFVFGRAQVSATQAGTLDVSVFPNSVGTLLLDRHRYRVTLRLWVTYEPAGGSARAIGYYGLQLGGSCPTVTATVTRTTAHCT